MRNVTVLMSMMLAGVLLALPGRCAQADATGPHEHAGTPPMGPWDAKSMQKDLGLSDDQVSKLNAVRDEQKDVMQSIMSKSQELMTKLQDQVKNKASDTDISTTLSDIDMNHKNAAEQAEKFKAEKDAVLTPMQRAQMMLIHRPMMGRGMMRGKMPPKGAGKPAPSTLEAPPTTPSK